MNKNVKLSYILFFVFCGILIAWNTLMNFFGGVAINFVAVIGLTFTVSLLFIKDKEVFKRVKDLFFISCGFCLLELIVYFAFEFGWNSDFATLKGFLIYQNVITCFGFLFLAYVAFRFICEVKDKKIKFIEIMLGNEKRSIKAKKAKEVSNGSLEEKPNKHNNEDNVIIETEE